MREPRRLVLLGVACVFAVASACRDGIKSNEHEAWKGQYRVEVKDLLRIGSEGLDDDTYELSAVNDIRFDAADNVYVLERKAHRIKVFSPKGAYLRTLELRKGQGPGEFQNPLNFDIGKDGNIYIADMFSPRVTSIDQEGRPLGEAIVRQMPGQIVVGKDGSLYMTKGLRDPGQFQVWKFQFPSGKLLAKFCPENELSRWIGRVGGNGDICLGPGGNIYFSFSIPYDIREFTPDGDLVRRLGRKIPSWSPPRITDSGLPDSPIFTAGMGVLPDGKLLHAFLDRRSEPLRFCVDVFDREGKWLISFNPRADAKEGFGRLLRIDSRGSIYLDFWQPYPHIRKYKVAFVPVHEGAKEVAITAGTTAHISR